MEVGDTDAHEEIKEGEKKKRDPQDEEEEEEEEKEERKKYVEIRLTKKTEKRCRGGNDRGRRKRLRRKM